MGITLLQRLRSVVQRSADRFIRLGESGLPEAEESRVRAVRLASVVHNTPWMMAANVANVVLALAAFWNSPVFPLLGIWAGLIFIVAAVTGGTWLNSRRATPRLRASIRGTRQAIIYAALLSGLWASLVAGAYPHADFDQKLVLVALTVGMAGGGGIALATIPPAAIAFGFFIGAGSLAALISHPNVVGVYLLALYVIYIAMIVRSSLALCDSLSDRMRAQLAANEQRDVIGLLLNDFEENAADWLWGVDADMRLKRASPQLFALLDKRRHDVLDKPLWEALPLETDHGGPESMPTDILRQCLATKEAFRDVELSVRLGEGPRILSLSAKPMVDEHGNFCGFRGVARDVTAAREARSRVEYMARHDPLTNVANRSLLQEEMELALQRLRRFNDGFNVLLLDLDRFKQVNDTHGHGAGDELLKIVAARLASLLDDSDTLARLGGDEFAIVQVGAGSPKRAEELAERAIEVLSAPCYVGGASVRVGASIGIACAPVDGLSVDSLMRNADLALYRAKSDGRNRYRFFDSSLDEASRRRNAIETALRDAVAAENLTLHYQPLCDARTGKVTCAETLLRWTHPTLGPISPAEFVPIAEDAGIIGDIGAWVIRQACVTATQWPESVRVAVNLSPRQFASPGLFAAVRAALRESGLPSERLELEVTESLLLDSPDTIGHTLEALRRTGIRIALDDFGTGYSSLSYLRNYRFDKIKIDQSFVNDIDSVTQSRSIVEAIIRVGLALDMSIAAEGVETEGQLNVLRELGCNEIQGYLIGRPQPADQLAHLLQEDVVRQPSLVGVA